jgi:hypothetical protein
MTREQNQIGYLKWLAANHPRTFRDTMLRVQASMPLAGLGQLGWLNFVIQAIATVGSAVAQKKQVDKQVSLQKKALALSDAQASADRVQAAQIELLHVNTERAAAGLPPVDLQGKPVNTGALATPKVLAPYVKSTTIIPGVPDVATYLGAAAAAAALLKVARVW